MVNYSQIIGRVARLMYKPSVRDSPFDRVPEKASIWDRGRTETCGGGKRVSGGTLLVSQYFRIYRSGIRSDRASRGQQGNRARPPPSWAPCCSTDVLLPPIYTYVPPNHQIRSKNPISTTATFCTREIPSWGLFRRPARGGIDHGGLLHQHHSLSDDVWVVYLRPSGP